MESKVLENKAVPRGKYPHVKKIGEWIFVSGTSCRRPDNTFAGVEVDAVGQRGDARADVRKVHGRRLARSETGQSKIVTAA